MIYLKENPKGIDLHIQWIQQHLYDKLSNSLNCDIVAYGRAYKDVLENVTTPVVYLKNGEYKEVLTDDNIKGLHYFFIENDESDVLEHTCMSSTDIDIIFIIDDLTKVKSDILHYPDEELKEEIKSYIRSFLEIKTVTKGESALKEFDTSKIHFTYPYFVFKIKGTINNY